MNKAVQIWLWTIVIFILAVVVIGGITRLTLSGLSIVDWRPIMGILPPLTPQEWLETFQKYQAFPQYQKLNLEMTLEEFKSIFFWEYLHRILARAIAVIVIIPCAFFSYKKILSKKTTRLVLMGFFLGGLQGLLGWFMVKSGLVDRPSVSHLRLAAHLSLALFIYCYFLWIIFSQAKVKPIKGPKILLQSLMLIFFLQIVYGAFTAGLKAGHIYNTFPLMNGVLIPEEIFYLPTYLENVFYSPGVVQFIHRCLGWLILGFSVLLFFRSCHFKNSRLTKWTGFFLLGVFVQFFLGVATLLSHVSIPLAVMHQLTATVLLGGILYLNCRIGIRSHNAKH